MDKRRKKEGEEYSEHSRIVHSRITKTNNVRQAKLNESNGAREKVIDERWRMGYRREKDSAARIRIAHGGEREKNDEIIPLFLP